MIIELKRLGLSCSLSSNAPEVFTLKERDGFLQKLSGKRICIDFQEDIDGPQTAARLIKETLCGFGVIFKDLKEGVDVYVWIQQGSREMQFVFAVADPSDKKHYLCYECGPRELTASIMMAIYNFFYRARMPIATPQQVNKIQIMISSLDTAEGELIRQIEDEIAQYGEQCVDALIASANDCNRKITAATIGQDWKVTREGMKSLERRIRVLGVIRSPIAISTILDALADSAGAAEITGFAEADSLCGVAGEALVNIGEPAIPYLRDNINDSRLHVREAVRFVLSRLEPRKWWQFWKE
ncbi:MAG: hypothetical protein PHU34_10210 [Candidatus Methanoperedens sp.]|nr:hypothetical protein [Candidatus Methanoperedens sp.]